MFTSNVPNIIKEYRPELNGLRALAVILVLLFHLDISWMQGGFLGVDVFLVVSGYFISKNILYGLQNNSFTFKKFYTKRLRRLFPALIFTLILVVIAGYFFFTPSSYERLGKSAIFASFSLSNFFFWSEAGYFNLESTYKPLLHMWSLSLEEQFYLFWPLLLVVLYKFKKQYLHFFILVIAIISIVLGEIYIANNPSAVFFLIPFRMFEFLLGASCIWLEKYFFNKKTYILESLFFIGLVLIVYSSVKFDHFTRMPGVLSLVPCVGTMFIIVAGKAPKLSWVLKNNVVETIGKASYSIYLIHWPIIVYYKYWTLSDLSLSNQISIGLSSIVAGLLMWHFIENTFRYRKSKKSKIDPIWFTVPTLILVISSFSLFIWKSEGVTSRFTDELYMTKAEILENRKMYFDEYKENQDLLKGKPNSGHVMVLGNSHSVDLIFALRQNGFNSKITSLKSLGKCYNFGQSYDENAAKDCKALLSKNLNNKNWNKVDAIFLHDNWPKLEVDGLKEIIEKIRNISNAPIYVFGPKMTYVKQIPEIVRLSNSISPKIINKKAEEFSRKDFKLRLNNNLKKELSKPFYRKLNVSFIDILALQGGENPQKFEIVSSDDLKFLYFDNSHFTKKGSKKLGKKLKDKHPSLFDIKNLK